MYISHFKLTNFKSFREPAALSFSTGLNIIVGQNNAGKSALLEAIGLTPSAIPHKSPRTAPFEGAPPPDMSTIEISFSLSREELMEMLSAMPGTKFVLPFPDYTTDFARSIGFVDESPQSRIRLGKWFLSQEQYTFDLRRETRESELRIGFQKSYRLSDVIKQLPLEHLGITT
jgi:AAA ATPase domain